MLPQTSSNLAAESWAIADLLRGDFKQSQYGRIILPFCLLRRLECVLEPTKAAVLAEHEKTQKMNVPEEAQEKLLLRATNGLTFFNISIMDLSKLGEAGIKVDTLKLACKNARITLETREKKQLIANRTKILRLVCCSARARMMRLSNTRSAVRYRPNSSPNIRRSCRIRNCCRRSCMSFMR